MVIAYLFLVLGAVSAQSLSQCTTFCTDYNNTCGQNSTVTWSIATPIWTLYTTDQDCINECLLYPQDPNCLDGSSASLCAAGNSWGCRRYHLNVAQTSYALAAVHCPHTAPLSSWTTDITIPSAYNGTTPCHSNADFNASVAAWSVNTIVADFCNQAVGTCSTYLQGLTTPRCISIYQSVGGATDVSYMAGAGGRMFPLAATPSSTNLWCRRYHAQAARLNASYHCPHAIFGGQGVCGSDCSTFCNSINAICTGANAQYGGDVNTCMTDCAGFRLSTNYTDFTGNTVQCRLYHLSVASDSVANAAYHCPHTGATGASVCVDAKSAAAGTTASFVVVALAVLAKFFM